VGEPTALPVGKELVAQIQRPDGSVFTAAAWKEWLLRRNLNPIEDEAFVLAGVDKADVPEGSTVEISQQDGSLAGEDHGEV
jgi:hypothetical protein